MGRWFMGGSRGLNFIYFGGKLDNSFCKVGFDFSSDDSSKK